MLKKVLLTGLSVLLVSCASDMQENVCDCEEDAVYENYSVEYVNDCAFVSQEQLQCPCQNAEEGMDVDPCQCIQEQPVREVLRPRIKEIAQEKPRRDCPADKQVINCGCGDCQVMLENKPADNKVREIIPAMPEAYKLAASRVFSRFIKDTGAIYTAKPNVLLYIKSVDIKGEDMPDGVKEAVTLFKNKLLASFTYALTDDENNNDYYLETYVDWFDTVSKTVPAIQYTTVLHDKDGKAVDTWVEIVKKAENSETWL